jgi:hypothetical protein
MTKSSLISAINTQLTAIITQAKVRLASLELVNEIYPTTIEEFYAPPASVLSITNFLVTDLEYKIKFKKVGNTVFVDGSITNETGLIVSGEVIEIINSEYLPRTGDSFNCSTNSGALLTIVNDKISVSTIGVSENHYFNFTYNTND